MPNLGSSNTPVEGANFGLPAGAELTEDANGNLAIADSTGSIVLVRDETNAEWQFENTDLTGINSIDASSANFGSINTEDTTTETLAYDYSEGNPQWPRQPEQGSQFFARPYPDVDQPILEDSDVGISTSGAGVADPLIRWDTDNGQWVIFAEIYPDGTENQDIYYWTSSDLRNWAQGDRLNLSSSTTGFPYTFRYDATWYMTPDFSSDEDGLHIYQADSFPGSWSLVETVLPNENLKDPVVFEFSGKWWVLAYDTAASETNLFYADKPVNGSWSAHPDNPLMGGRIPGGTPIVRSDYIDVPDHVVNINRITELTTSSFAYTDSVISNIAVFTQNGGWNNDNMHTFDLCMAGPTEQPVIIVDGKDNTGSTDTWNTGLYTTSELEISSATLYDSTGTTMDSGTFTEIGLDSIAHDVRNATGSGRYTTPTSGYYEISGQVTVDNVNSTTPFNFLVQANTSGEGIISRSEQPVSVGGENRGVALATTTEYLPAGTEVYLQVFNRGDSQETAATGRNNTHLSVKKIVE